MSVQLTPIEIYLNRIAAENRPLSFVHRVNRLKQDAIDKVRDFILQHHSFASWVRWATFRQGFKEIATQAIYTYISERSGLSQDLANKIATLPQIAIKKGIVDEQIDFFLRKTSRHHYHWISEKLPTDVDYWNYEMGQIGAKYQELIDAYNDQQRSEACAQNISA